MIMNGLIEYIVPDKTNGRFGGVQMTGYIFGLSCDSFGSNNTTKKYKQYQSKIRIHDSGT